MLVSFGRVYKVQRNASVVNMHVFHKIDSKITDALNLFIEQFFDPLENQVRGCHVLVIARHRWATLRLKKPWL